MKNNVKKIIFILVILLILTIILLRVFTKTPKQEDNVEQEVQIRQEKTQEYFSDKVMPQGISTLYKRYNGKNDKNDLYKNLYNLVRYLPQMYDYIKDLDESTLASYYDTNANNIKTNLGITDRNSYIDFAKYIQTIEFDSTNFSYCKIDTESYDSYNVYLTFNLALFYDKLEKPIDIKVYFSNQTGTDENPEIIYGIVK